MLLMIWLCLVAAALVLYLRQVHRKFIRGGVRQPPTAPFIGNMSSVLFRREHFTVSMMKVYNLYPEDKVIGQYEFLKPLLLIKDLELVKKITVKDFDYFADRRTVIDEKNDPLFGRNLLSLKSDEWRDMRSTLSPAFTSSKIKLMVPFMTEVGDQMIDVLKKRIQQSGVGYIDVDTKDLATRYANDVIASCAFGLKVDSQAEDNLFYKKCKEVTTFTFLQLLAVMGYSSFPKIMKALKVTLFSKQCKEFFQDVVLSTMRHREEQHVIRYDMIHLLMEAKKGQLSHDSKTSDEDAGFATIEESAVGKKQINREWSDMDLIAQAVLFLFAGFDTVSTAMSFMLHELALNPDVQERLAQEIKDTHVKNDDKFNYNSIQHMPYLDMVVSEVLRKWPGAPVTDRVCMKDYNIGRPNNITTKDYIIRKGDAIQIPMWAFHHDPKYFPNPENFDPERFSDENKHKIMASTYMPFGLGPRNCIGSRFALCEVKVMAYQLLLHMEVSPCEKTCTSSKLSLKEPFLMRLQGGHWVRMRLRQ